MSQSAHWIYGTHAVKAILKNKRRKVVKFCVLKEDTELSNIRKDIRPTIVDKNFFCKTFGRDALHQGCAVLVHAPENLFIEDVVAIEGDSPIVILDQVTDPHNIGAILRSCAVFEARALIVQDSGSPENTSVVAKTASGALEIVPIVRVANISRTIQFLKDKMFWCVGLSEYGTKELSEVGLKGKFAFVIGSEGKGMRRLTRESCDVLAKLPSSECFSTLNAAQACTVTLYESFKQRKLR